MQPQRLVVPLFQRRYVWNQENQWEPLWNDVIRVANRLLNHPHNKPQPHFLGAVVLQQVQNPVGLMQTRIIIDGQQRLTTLQLLLDALHAELVSVEAIAPAARLEPLITNAEPFCTNPEDRFKVWPTNRDREAFNAVMAASPPVDHDSLGFQNERMVEAHRFFSEQAREWLSLQSEHSMQSRAAATENAVRELLQMVVIDLGADENAQEIFETLNARGAQLTAADLIKNFIFQRLLEVGADVETIYDRQWKEFETGFWETEINVGRLRYPRSSIFLNHFLVARTGEEIVAREVFDRFKRFADHEAKVPMETLLREVHEAAQIYQKFITDATNSGAIDRLGLFVYRTGVLESEVIKPLLLWLLDPKELPIPEAQFNKTLDCLESWMVRRMLVRATTKAYNKIIADLIAVLRTNPRENTGDLVERYLASAATDSSYWPDDDEIREELESLVAYRRLSQSRIRMVLEGIEDHLRGFRDEKSGLGDERVARGKYHIEHVMPRKWAANWPLIDGSREDERERLIHTIGNLTLLTQKLNSKVSNGPWLGVNGKRDGLEEHDVLILNRELMRKAIDTWTEDAIRVRTGELIESVVRIWHVPAGHKTPHLASRPRRRKKIRLPDLISAGLLEPGMTLYARGKGFRDRTATLLADGRIEVDGVAYASPSDAASAMFGRRKNGWWFFVVDLATRRSLRNIRRDYAEQLSDDVEDDDGEDDVDDADE
jgi:Uncharacterized conserved protein